MARQIFVFTAGNVAAQAHLSDSILRPIDVDQVVGRSQQLSEEELRQLAGDGLYAWGAIPGPQNTGRWNAMNAGDWVFGVWNGAYRCVGQIRRKVDDETLAESIWGRDPDGRTWQLMYFLRRPTQVEVPLGQLSDDLPESYQGFFRPSDASLGEIRTKYGSIDDFVKTKFGVEPSADLPREAEGPAPPIDVRDQITREDLLDAIVALDAGESHAFGRSAFYDVLHEGKRYPPKAVVGLAARRALGRPLRPDEFSGGEDSWSFRLLRKRGFEVVPKADQDASSGLLPSLSSLVGKSIWVENTKSSHQHGGAGWEFGTCLWSPARDVRGGDRYAPMREVREGDLVLHFYDAQVRGFSYAAGSVQERNDEPPQAADWAGRGLYYRVDVRDFQEFAEPIPIGTLVRENEAAIREELLADQPNRYPFVLANGVQVRTVQGGYLTQCTPKLYELFRRAVNGDDRDVRYWVISPGEQARLWDEFQQQNVVCWRRLWNEPACRRGH